MAPSRRRTKLEQARQYLTSGSALQEDSDEDVTTTEDQPWEWIYDEQGELPTPGKRSRQGELASNLRKRKAPTITGRRIIGARMGNFQCGIGDTVLLHTETNEPWVGLICEFLEEQYNDEGLEKMARFMWFSSHKEIRNKAKKRTDFLENELYITAASDNNPLTTINGKATVLSYDTFMTRFPTGQIKRNLKDHGKVFFCRRGVNTRTTTYTDVFDWKKIYTGQEDIPAVTTLVETQTKATRKRQARQKKGGDLDEFVVRDDNGDIAPRTPSKRRRLNDAATPTSKRHGLTPRKFLTPTHKRIITKKPLEFTPLGTRILSPNALSSPFQIARNQLHVSSVPATLPCREEEFSTVYSHLETAITDGSGSCIYISGTPGTGKTATVREVIAQLNAAVMAEELDDFIFVEINGMKVTDPHQSYSLLWEALRGDRVSPSHALELLEREFSSPSPRRVPCVVLMDELDQLVTKNQSVMYNFFNWPGLRHSRLIVLAVANTMDLPERTLSNKISSRLGLTRITFPGYTHEQLMQIIESRLSGVPGNIVHPDAVQFAARKVAAVSGDARRALDICRRAVEIAESEALAKEAESVPGTPSKTGRNAKSEDPLGKRAAIQGRVGMVTIATIKQAINEATSSPLQQYLRALSLAAKLFLAALLARIRRTGLGEAVLGDVVEEAKRLGIMSQLLPIHSYLLAGEQEGGEERTKEWQLLPRKSAARNAKQADGKAPRVYGLGAAAMELVEAGIVGVEARRGERVGRVRLGVGDEELRLALKDDDDVRGLGFGT